MLNYWNLFYTSLLWFSPLLPILWRASWFFHKRVMFPLWLDSTSGCYKREHLSCADPGFLSSVPFVFKKNKNRNSSFSPPSLSWSSFVLPICVVPSVTVPHSFDSFFYIAWFLFWLFLCKGRWIAALRHGFWMLRSAKAMAVSFVSDVFVWSRISRGFLFTQGQSKRSHFL